MELLKVDRQRFLQDTIWRDLDRADLDIDRKELTLFTDDAGILVGLRVRTGPGSTNEYFIPTNGIV